MKRAAVALGSNLGDRLENLRAAVGALAALPGTRVEALSHVYETEPVGYADQPAFLNAVVLLQTDRSARALLGACLGIEAALGRVRSFANGPRVIDLDLLAMEDASAEDAELTLPHPRMRQRGFVLVPLADVLPEGRLGALDFAADIRTVSREGVCRYDRELGV